MACKCGHSETVRANGTDPTWRLPVFGRRGKCNSESTKYLPRLPQGSRWDGEREVEPLHCQWRLLDAAVGVIVLPCGAAVVLSDGPANNHLGCNSHRQNDACPPDEIGGDWKQD
ncbi:hypothetical protein BDW62DRAFT_94808 [Aspergillus aurantiobrunneus]